MVSRKVEEEYHAKVVEVGSGIPTLMMQQQISNLTQSQPLSISKLKM